jgi:hypothetical protein
MSCKRAATANASPQLTSPQSGSFSSKELDSLEVRTVWEQMIQKVRLGKANELKHFLADSIKACNNNISSGYFIANCQQEIFSDLLLNRIEQSKNVLFKEDKVQVELMDDRPYVIVCRFTRMDNGTKLSSCDVYGAPTCCR